MDVTHELARALARAARAAASEGAATQAVATLLGAHQAEQAAARERRLLEESALLMERLRKPFTQAQMRCVHVFGDYVTPIQEAQCTLCGIWTDDLHRLGSTDPKP